MSRAQDLCEEFDAEIHGGDAFLDPHAAKSALEYVNSWKRELEERLANTLESHL